MTAAIGVCGFGRCGSTMVMSMLAAGGVPIAGGLTEPPYELPGVRKAWSLPLAGRAVKLLDSAQHYGVPPAAAWRFIWLDRDPIQQARSHIKFINIFMAAPTADDAVELFAASYKKDRQPLLDLLRRNGTVTILSYERVLADPSGTARKLSNIYPGLDADSAAATVHERDGICRPDLAVELAIASGGTS